MKYQYQDKDRYLDEVDGNRAVPFRGRKMARPNGGSGNIVQRKEATTMARDSQREKLKGTIKTIKKQEGYGFITHSATGTDYFFHRSHVRDITFEDLKLDMQVEFTPTEGPKGERAEEVTPLG